MDITSLSLAQLRELMHSLPKEIERREKEEKASVRQEIERIAREKGFDLADFISIQDKKPKYTVAIKYRHPNDASLTWTGRGRKPKWVEAFMANGSTLDQLLVP